MQDSIIIFLFSVSLITLISVTYLKEYKWAIGIILVFSGIVSMAIPVTQQTDNYNIMDKTTGTTIADFNVLSTTTNNADQSLLSFLTYGLIVFGFLIIGADMTSRILE